MSRIARIVLENVPYHITQRSNGRQQVFFTRTDYQLYLDLLRAYAEAARLQIWAYCLMPNHIHLIAQPERADAMAITLGRTHADFARYFNLSQRSCGHAWQARFFSCPLDATHLWTAMAYVERNPVRAGMVDCPSQYEWSSARVHLGLAENSFLRLREWQAEYTEQRGKQVLAAGVSEEAFGLRLHQASRRGRPLGDEGFTDDLERLSGRHLRPLPVGRPRKQAQEECGQLTLEIGV